MMVSCKKEYEDKFNIIPGDTVIVKDDRMIETFSIPEFSADTVLKASIVNGEILVYWPNYKAVPDSISPQITIPNTATITPASGTKIPFQQGVTYTVKAQSGRTSAFKLSIIFQQPNILLNFLTLFLYQVNPGENTINIRGDGILPGTNETKVFLIHNTSGNTIDVTKYINNITTNNIRLALNGFETWEVGDYQYKITSGVRTVTSGYNKVLCIRKEAQPGMAVYWPGTVTAKVGDVITMTGENISFIDSIMISNGTTVYKVHHTATTNEIKITIANGTSIGTYKQLFLYSRERYGTGNYGQLTFTEPNTLEIK